MSQQNMYARMAQLKREVDDAPVTEQDRHELEKLLLGGLDNEFEPDAYMSSTSIQDFDQRVRGMLEGGLSLEGFDAIVRRYFLGNGDEEETGTWWQKVKRARIGSKRGSDFVFGVACASVLAGFVGGTVMVHTVNSQYGPKYVDDLVIEGKVLNVDHDVVYERTGAGGLTFRVLDDEGTVHRFESGYAKQCIATALENGERVELHADRYDERKTKHLLGSEIFDRLLIDGIDTKCSY